MAVIRSEVFLRRDAFEALQSARDAGECVVLTRDGRPAAIMLTFDEYVRLRTGGGEPNGGEALRQLEREASERNTCVRNCPLRRSRPRGRDVNDKEGT